MARLASTLVAVVLMCAAATAPAAHIEGVRFEPQVRIGDALLELHGYALLRYKMFFKAYVAALYLKPSATAQEVLADTPKRLEIEYFWGISASDFAQATVDGIAANVTAADFERLRGRIGEFNTLYEDVKPGDRYALTYLPDIGTELTLNGKRLGSVGGSDFAAAMFSIWLGDKPLDADLKDQLLSRR